MTAAASVAVLIRRLIGDSVGHQGCRWRGTEPIPPAGAPRRFACALVTAGLVVSLWLASGAISTGRRFGMALLLFPAIETATGFCVPSWCVRRVANAIKKDDS